MDIMCMSGPGKVKELRKYLGDLVEEINGGIKVWGEEESVETLDEDLFYNLAQRLGIKEIHKSKNGEYNFNLGRIGVWQSIFTISLDSPRSRRFSIKYKKRFMIQN